MKSKGFWGWFFKIIAIILLMIPLLILTLIKKEYWFIDDSPNVSIGFIMALLFAIMLLKGAFKNLDKRLTTCITLLVFTLIVYLLDSIIVDLFWILLCSFIGYILYLIFDSIGSHLVNTWNIYKHEHVRSKARDDYEQEQKEIRGNV